MIFLFQVSLDQTFRHQTSDNHKKSLITGYPMITIFKHQIDTVNFRVIKLDTNLTFCLQSLLKKFAN